MNIAILMGRVTSDIEVKKTPSGLSVAKFNVAVDRPSKQGEEKKTDFISVICWRGTAEFVGKYFKKGQMIAVEGSIQTGSYEKDGVKRNTFDIVADKVSFCGDKGESKPAPKEEVDPLLIDADEDMDDLPF
jgi:single-strand DNA-binding protein